MKTKKWTVFNSDYFLMSLKFPSKIDYKYTAVLLHQFIFCVRAYVRV